MSTPEGFFEAQIPPVGYCGCGCGERTRIADHTDRARGWVKGQPIRFIQLHQSRGFNRWNRKRIYTRNQYGYTFVKVPGGDYVGEHVLVAEQALGKKLPKGAVVHHVNEDRADNRNQNLVVCQDLNYHMLLHRRAEAYRATGDPKSRKCVHCGRYDGEVFTTKNGRHAYHRKCAALYQSARRRNRQRKTKA